MFEKCVFIQISYFFDNILSKYVVLGKVLVPNIVFLQCWKNGKGLSITVKLLAHYWQICRRLLIASATNCQTKRNVYRFSLTTLKLINNYSSNWKQRTKINLSYNSWQEIIFGVPQGPILGLLLFNPLVPSIY